MPWTLGVATAAALVFVAGGCGSTITVPDQGIIVTGCQLAGPALCYRNDCPCTRAAIGTSACTVPCVEGVNGDPSTCDCPSNVPVDVDLGTHYDSVCIETAQACIGRGVLCAGPNARCKEPGATCDGTGDLPMQIAVIPVMGMPPILEPHCQYDQDICCNATASDGGTTTD